MKKRRGKQLIFGDVPKEVRRKTHWYRKYRCMGLYDAFKEAVRESDVNGHELQFAFYYDDYRKFIPSEYLPEYLDFEKYPLRYQDKIV